MNPNETALGERQSQPAACELDSGVFLTLEFIEAAGEPMMDVQEIEAILNTITMGDSTAPQ